MIRVLPKNKKKPIYVYDATSGMMKRVGVNEKVKKRARGSALCCASPIIITKSVKIGKK